MSAKVLLVANQKGGVGKSTIALNLGVGLLARGLKVLMLDADGQQSLSKWRRNAVDEPHEKDVPWVERWDDPMIGEKIIKERPNYDYIVIDSSGSLGERGDKVQKTILACIRNADLIITPVAPSPFDVDGSEDFVDLMRDIWARNGEQTPPVYFLVNGLKEGTLLSKEVADYISEMYQLPVLHSKILAREAYRQCVGSGSSIFHYKEPTAQQNMNELITEICGIANGEKQVEAV